MTRCSISGVLSPVYCQMMVTTGMLISGEMSVGILTTAVGRSIQREGAIVAGRFVGPASLLFADMIFRRDTCAGRGCAALPAARFRTGGRRKPRTGLADER